MKFSVIALSHKNKTWLLSMARGIQVLFTGNAGIKTPFFKDDAQLIVGVRDVGKWEATHPDMLL